MPHKDNAQGVGCKGEDYLLTRECIKDILDMFATVFDKRHWTDPMIAQRITGGLPQALLGYSLDSCDYVTLIRFLLDQEKEMTVSAGRMVQALGWAAHYMVNQAVEVETETDDVDLGLSYRRAAAAMLAAAGNDVDTWLDTWPKLPNNGDDTDDEIKERFAA